MKSLPEACDGFTAEAYLQRCRKTTGEVIIEGMKAAKKAGAVVSFDLNFREKLWNIWGGQKKAEEIVARIGREHRRARWK